eukprot:TRINITY_DN32598_c0_g1_i1.p1 TRINITY_DN32598_c0_g1~~TRINITY_DN32598_c0_g1_i1.p1  ORF type:complete len:620 (-),score=99.21 TRINITY_DN32598_c0_g1_i1:101-1960(-)
MPKYEFSVAVKLQVEQHVIDPVADWPIGWLVGYETDKGTIRVINAIRCMKYGKGHIPDFVGERAQVGVLLPHPVRVVGMYISPDNPAWPGKKEGGDASLGGVQALVGNMKGKGLDSIITDTGNFLLAVASSTDSALESLSVQHWDGAAWSDVELKESDQAGQPLNNTLIQVHTKYTLACDRTRWTQDLSTHRDNLKSNPPAYIVQSGSTHGALHNTGAGKGDSQTVGALVAAENKKTKGSKGRSVKDKESVGIASVQFYDNLSGDSNGKPTPPTLSLGRGAPQFVALNVHIVTYTSPDTSCTSLGDTILAQIDNYLESISTSAPGKAIAQVVILPFLPIGYPHAFTIVYDIDPAVHGDPSEAYLQAQRKDMSKRLGLPLDRPFLRTSNALSLPRDSSKEATTGSGKKQSVHLHNVHEGLPPTGVKGGTQYITQGVYAYYHYMQDGFDDNGWGCAYRSLMTICSWLQLQGYSGRSPPDHREIQQVLVDLEDKEPKFLGSKQWIGAFECNLVLNQLYGVQCKILSVNSGAELADKGRELAHHFTHQGTPIMVGGGVLAYTILGIDWNDQTGDIKFLILDPHYVGADEIKPIQKKWCSWHEPSIWRADAFYNLCMPQRPDEC